jgi:hypothetical protein
MEQDETDMCHCQIYSTQLKLKMKHMTKKNGLKLPLSLEIINNQEKHNLKVR